MRNLGLLSVLCLLASCEWFASQETKTKKLVDAELQQIDWNDVDQYPLFVSCDETQPKEAQRNCFETTLLRHLSATLKGFEFVTNADMEDTLYVDFLVDNKGIISVLDIEKHNLVQEQIPEFNAIITQSLANLPELGPALKRGIPVNAKCRIPLLLSTN